MIKPSPPEVRPCAASALRPLPYVWPQVRCALNLAAVLQRFLEGDEASFRLVASALHPQFQPVPNINHPCPYPICCCAHLLSVSTPPPPPPRHTLGGAQAMSAEVAVLVETPFGEELLHAIGWVYVNKSEQWLGFHDGSLLSVDGRVARLEQVVPHTRALPAPLMVAPR